MGCPEFGEAVSALSDGELDADEAANVQAHLAVCARCRVGLARAAELNRLLATQAANARCLPDRPGLYLVGVAACGCPATCSCGCQRNEPCWCTSRVA